jgi:hypothetical protein
MLQSFSTLVATNQKQLAHERGRRNASNNNIAVLQKWTQHCSSSSCHHTFSSASSAYLLCATWVSLHFEMNNSAYFLNLTTSKKVEV